MSAYLKDVNMQRTVNLRVVGGQRTNVSSRAISMQQIGTYSRAVNKQRTVTSRVVTEHQMDKNSIAKNAHPYLKSPTGYRGHTESLPAKE